MRFVPTVGFALGCCASIPAACAWGLAGHEIVATIAQIYLDPSVLPTLCTIIDVSSTNLSPLDSTCHIAPIATWADRYKSNMTWSAQLHFIGALDDHPPSSCAFPGKNGWAGTKRVNVLDGMKNVTALLQGWVKGETSDDAANEALKFLIHFFGDAHQPMHMTGRERGGNQVKVVFGGKQTNLHAVWDDSLITKATSTIPQNYTLPLPYPEVEQALRGSFYDPYIRRIIWEGILQKWADEKPGWLSCPDVVKRTSVDSQVALGLGETNGIEILPDNNVLCPYHWARPTHDLLCDGVWPKEVDEPPYKRTDDNPHPPLLELDTPAYSGMIEQRWLVEKQLAQGGLRLAGILNHIFADQCQRGAFIEGF